MSFHSVASCVKADLIYFHNHKVGEVKYSLGLKHFMRAYLDVDFRVLFYWRLCMALSSKKYLKHFGILIFFRLKSRYGVDLSPWAIVDPGIRLMHAFGIVVGPKVRIQMGTTIFHQVTLGMSRPDKESLLMPSIGRYCILGAGSKILGAVSIPDGSLVPANLLITGKILSESIKSFPEVSSAWHSHVQALFEHSYLLYNRLP